MTPIYILLDPHRPELLPALDIAKLAGRVQYPAGVDPQVRTVVEKLIAPGETPIFLTYDPADVPADAQVVSGWDSVTAAVAAMRTALTIGEWEQTQTHQSLIPYLKEEVTEVIEAIEKGETDEQLRLELGDLLLQVLFHAEIAAQRQAFNFYDVAEGFVQKLHKRAPYLFDGTREVVTIDTQERLWQLGKQQA